MKKINRKLNGIVLSVLIALLVPSGDVRGTIASIVLTPANPTTLSNGLSYYLAGIEYSFDVQVIDPDLTGWADITNVQVTIPNSTNIVLSINPTGTGAAFPVTVSSGTVDAEADISGTYNNCTVTFKVTFRWDTEESVYTAARNIVASADTSVPAANTATDTGVTSYGVCSSMKILNFAQDGIASDGMVNPYHDGFNVTGTPVYDVPGVTSADAIETVDGGEITGTTLYLNGAATAFTDGTPAGLSYAVTTGIVSAFGANTWTVRATMTEAGGPETSSNSLSLDCDEVEITGITILNGGGVDAPDYYRSINVAGTQVQVTARMRNSLSAMVGNTTVRIRNYTENLPANDIYVTIANGSNTGTAFVTDPTAGGYPANPGTTQNFYRAEIIEGGSYGGDSAQGQNVNTRINQPAAVSIYWDLNDAPGANGAPFTPWTGVSATAYSLTFNWTALADAAPDQDFYSYRIYYRENGTVPYNQVDVTTAGFAALGTITTNTATITGLTPLTNYDYYITAVDVFGQEVSLANSLPGTGTFDSVGTLASTIRVDITDGITSYDDNTFTDSGVDDPSARPLIKSAVRVKVFVVAAGDLPDVVNLIVANTTTGNLIDGTGVIDPGLTENDPAGYYRITTLKTGSNEWTGYIPETNSLIAVGTSVKFIVETIKDGVSSYADNDSETESPPGAPNDYPYTFLVSDEPVFTPWPTRVLNNVITDKNPRAYPAYYLSDDAYVTIKVYDIKGRVVNTLLDKGFRKGGQNIKEGGWGGDNRYKRKLGVGLYYLHFKAKRVSDGKVILNSFKKVVMAR